MNVHRLYMLFNMFLCYTLCKETNQGSEKKRLRTYGHLINKIIGCNNIVLDSMSKFNLKIETNFINIVWEKGNGE